MSDFSSTEMNRSFSGVSTMENTEMNRSFIGDSSLFSGVSTMENTEMNRSFSVDSSLFSGVSTMENTEMNRSFSVDSSLFSGMSTMENTEFIHFPTSEECDSFALYLKENNITIKHKCCSDKGCCLVDTNTIYIKDIIQNYHKKKLMYSITNDFFIQANNTPLNKFGTCDICMEEDKCLITRCNTCKHPFCSSCLDKISKCAICREPH